MNIYIIAGVVVVALAVAVAGAFVWLRGRGRPVPESLQQGQPLPAFSAVSEEGAPVHSTDLRGAPAVLLFVRGNWCPFCNSQVKNLTKYYKDIQDLGAKLILVTPKPLQTTRRVAEFFDVEFDFWLDESLAVARQLELLHVAGVPSGSKSDYGENTVWPTALVVDSDGQIVFVNLSKFIADRPDPKTLLGAVRSSLKP